MDLYQIHRWDYNTPIEETMEALHDVVKAGKALGAPLLKAVYAHAALFLFMNGHDLRNYIRERIHQDE